jgi:hypothetical protein
MRIEENGLFYYRINGRLQNIGYTGAYFPRQPTNPLELDTVQNLKEWRMYFQEHLDKMPNLVRDVDDKTRFEFEKITQKHLKNIDYRLDNLETRMSILEERSNAIEEKLQSLSWPRRDA